MTDRNGKSTIPKNLKPFHTQQSKMIDTNILFAALSIGFFSSTHCVFMCGGIASALSFSIPLPQNKWKVFAFPILFGLGRISTYALLGAVFASAGTTIATQTGELGISIIRGIAGLMLILMGLYLAGWWKILAYTEQAGAIIWKRVSPLIDRLKPVDRFWKAFFIGVLWGWLPCGLVYSTLIWSSVSGNTISGALIMLSFGIGTLPAIYATGTFSTGLQQFLGKKFARQLAGVGVIAFGVWTIAGPHLLMKYHLFH